MYPNMANTQKLQDIEPVIIKSTVMMRDPCIRPKFRSSPTNTFTALLAFQEKMLVHCLTLFQKLKGSSTSVITNHQYLTLAT